MAQKWDNELAQQKLLFLKHTLFVCFHIFRKLDIVVRVTDKPFTTSRAAVVREETK